jgi:hypothetical protein
VVTAALCKFRFRFRFNHKCAIYLHITLTLRTTIMIDGIYCELESNFTSSKLSSILFASYLMTKCVIDIV